MITADFTKSLVAEPRRAAATESPRPKAALSIKAEPSKSDIVAKLLARPKGATIAEVSGATGWQAHSVRAFLSGLPRKGWALERGARKEGTSSYRLMPSAGKPTTPPVSATASASEEGSPAVSGG